MRTRLPLLAALLALALIAIACGDDGAGGPTATPAGGLVDGVLTVTRQGNAVSGLFTVEGPFDVRVSGDNVTTANSRIFLYNITPSGNGFRTKVVAGSGPKAQGEGITQRPGQTLDLTFDLGPGDYYVLVKTDPANQWTITVTNVAGLPAG
jgi:hypothetical protein